MIDSLEDANSTVDLDILMDDVSQGAPQGKVVTPDSQVHAIFDSIASNKLTADLDSLMVDILLQYSL